MEWSGKIQGSMTVKKVKKTTITTVIIMLYNESSIYILEIIAEISIIPISCIMKMEQKCIT